MGTFKSRTDIQYLREAGRIAGIVCDELMEACLTGVSTIELEAQANRLLQMNRSTAPFKDFEGFGHAICVSINEEIVNGPPSRERILKDGDVISIAVGSCYRGFHGKAARTICVGGNPTPEIERLLTGTREILDMAVDISRQTPFLKAILEQLPLIAFQYELSLTQEGGGCGIGKQLHEAPWIPNDATKLEGDVALVPGFAFTLMPMMAIGDSSAIAVHEDGWTQVTANGAIAAHFAETYFMTPEGLEILTRQA